MGTVVEVLKIIRALLILIVAFIVLYRIFFFASGLSIFTNKRFQRYRRDVGLLLALFLFIGVLSQVVYRPLGLLAIPVFFFGGLYAVYDAFLKRNH